MEHESKLCIENFRISSWLTHIDCFLTEKHIYTHISFIWFISPNISVVYFSLTPKIMFTAQFHSKYPRKYLKMYGFVCHYEETKERDLKELDSAVVFIVRLASHWRLAKAKLAGPRLQREKERKTVIRDQRKNLKRV